MGNLKKYGHFTYELLKCRMLGLRKPLFTALAVTNRCNYRCIYCYGDYYHQRHDNLSPEEITAAIDDLHELGCQNINLIGGEPLMRDDLDTFVRYVKQKGILCTVSTNASLLDEKFDLVRDVDVLDTSLDGLEEHNDRNRGPGTFQRTLRGIHRAIAEKKPINVNMVLTRYNLDDVEPMLHLAKDTGFSLSFNIVFEPHSSDSLNYDQTFESKAIDNGLFQRAMDTILDYRKRGFPVRFSKTAYQYARDWPFDYERGVYVTHSKSFTKGFKPIPCYFHQFHCYIDTDANIYNCLILKDKYPTINIKTMGVKRAWETLADFRPPCEACYAICNNDANLIFGLNPAVLLSTAGQVIRQTIKTLNPTPKKKNPEPAHLLDTPATGA